MLQTSGIENESKKRYKRVLMLYNTRFSVERVNPQ